MNVLKMSLQDMIAGLVLLGRDYPPLSWVAHALVAGAITYVFRSPWPAIVFYTLREFEQTVTTWSLDGLFAGWVDTLGDAISPVLGALFVMFVFL